MDKDVRVTDSLDRDTLNRLPADQKLLKKIAEELEAESDTKHLAEVFLKIMRHKKSPAIFRAIGALLGPEKNVLVLKNVVAVFGRQYKEGSVQGLTHLYPLIVEAQQVIEKEKRERTKTRRMQKKMAKQKESETHASA